MQRDETEVTVIVTVSSGDSWVPFGVFLLMCALVGGMLWLSTLPTA